MNILVLSDSHGCVERLKDIIEAHSDMDAVIFCGDGQRDILAAMNELPCMKKMKVIAVAGNCDTMSDFPRTSFDELDGKKFYITHGHYQYVKSGYDYIAMDAEKNGREVVCFGHTHRQFFENWGKVFLFNPGAVLNSCYGTIHIHDSWEGITFRHYYWDHNQPVLHDECHF